MHGASDAGNPFTRRHDQDDIQSRSGTGSSALSAIAVNVGGQTVTVRVPSSPAFGRAPACKLPRLHVGTPVTQGIVATSGTEVTVGVRVDAPARVGLLIEDRRASPVPRLSDQSKYGDRLGDDRLERPNCRCAAVARVIPPCAPRCPRLPASYARSRAAGGDETTSTLGSLRLRSAEMLKRAIAADLIDDGDERSVRAGRALLRRRQPE